MLYLALNKFEAHLEAEVGPFTYEKTIGRPNLPTCLPRPNLQIRVALVCLFLYFLFTLPVVFEFEAHLEAEVGPLTHEKMIGVPNLPICFPTPYPQIRRFIFLFALPVAFELSNAQEQKWNKTLGKLKSNQFTLVVKARHWYWHNLSEVLNMGSVLDAMETVCTELAKVQQPATPWHAPPLAETGNYYLHHHIFVAKEQAQVCHCFIRACNLCLA